WHPSVCARLDGFRLCPVACDSSEPDGAIRATEQGGAAVPRAEDGTAVRDARRRPRPRRTALPGGGGGYTAWVRNALASGTVALRKGRRREELRVRALADDRYPAFELVPRR